MCSTCKLDGLSCRKDADCCNGTCTSGKCGFCEGPSCAEAAQGGVDPADLCGAALDDDDALLTCICSGACKSSCSSTICAGQQGNDVCFACIENVNTGCGNQLDDCANN